MPGFYDTEFFLPAERSFLIHPESPWTEGEKYRIEIDVGAEAASRQPRLQSAEVTIGPAVVGSGELVLNAHFMGESRMTLVDLSGACSGEHSVISSSLTADWREESGPFPRAMMHFQTYVDGVRWRPRALFCSSLAPGASWQGRGVDRVVAVCDDLARDDASVSPTVHTVRMEAALPGSDIVFVSNEVEVDLSGCKPAARVEDAGAPDDTALNPVDISSNHGCHLPTSGQQGPSGSWRLCGLVVAASAGRRRAHRSSCSL